GAVPFGVVARRCRAGTVFAADAAHAIVALVAGLSVEAARARSAATVDGGLVPVQNGVVAGRRATARGRELARQPFATVGVELTAVALRARVRAAATAVDGRLVAVLLIVVAARGERHRRGS